MSSAVIARSQALIAGHASAGRQRSTGALVLALSALGLSLAACSAAPGHRPVHSGPLAARTRRPAAATWVLAGQASADAVDVARKLFVSSPVVIIARAGSRSALAAAAGDALTVYAPVLLASPQSGKPSLRLPESARAEIRALRPQAVLA